MRRRSEFTHTVRFGDRSGGRTLTLHLDPNSAPGAAAVGFVLPRAVGTAVCRNRIRRQLRHLMRTRLAALADHDAVVVRVGPAAAGASYGELGADLDRALSRLGRRLPAYAGERT
jgi:ribonuclease P protein component